MRYKSFIVATACLLILSVCSYGQDEIAQEIGFSQHLGNMKAFDDQIFVLQELLDNPLLKDKDTIHYLLGKSYYQIKSLDHAIDQYEQVTNTSTSYLPATFWKSYLYSHLGNPEKSNQILTAPHINTPLYKSLRNLQLAGNDLLLRDYDSFNTRSSAFDGLYFQHAMQEESLSKLYTSLKKHKTKSPVLAGVMSAIVPGSGKMYSGKIGQGIASLVATSIMGLQTYEAYRKDGTESTRFIIYASLLSSFYIANIWGSVVSVKVRKREFDDTIDQQILLNMHIPLRTIFR